MKRGVLKGEVVGGGNGRNKGKWKKDGKTAINGD